MSDALVDRCERLDVELLRRVLEHITKHPDQFNQGNWLEKLELPAQPELTCNTSGCLAGWTALLVGLEPCWFDTRHLDTDYVRTTPKVSPEIRRQAKRHGNTFYPSDSNGEVVVHVKLIATSALGLTDDEANLLFYAENTLYDLWKIAETFSDGRITVPLSVTVDSVWADDEWDDFGEYWGVNRVGETVSR